MQQCSPAPYRKPGRVPAQRPVRAAGGRPRPRRTAIPPARSPSRPGRVGHGNVHSRC